VFDLIRKLRPYFFSLREIDNNVSLDIKLPLSWKYEELVKQYKSVKLKIQDKNDKVTLLSLVATATQDGYDVVFTCALEIVIFNKEEEEKQILFQRKVKELQELFKKEPLDKLKTLNLIDEYGQENTPSQRMVGEGDGEGQEGGGDTQEDDD
jgi:hypothetical protein